MQLELRVDAAGREEEGREEELRSLYAWLGEDPDTRSTAEVELAERPAGAGAMGGWLDAVQMVTENGWSAASFALAVLTWRQTRPARPRVTVRRGDLEIVLHEEVGEEEAARLVELLSRAEDDGSA